MRYAVFSIFADTASGLLSLARDANSSHGGNYYPLGGTRLGGSLHRRKPSIFVHVESPSYCAPRAPHASRLGAGSVTPVFGGKLDCSDARPRRERSRPVARRRSEMLPVRFSTQTGRDLDVSLARDSKGFHMSNYRLGGTRLSGSLHLRKTLIFKDSRSYLAPRALVVTRA